MSRAQSSGLYSRDYAAEPLPTVFQVGADVARTGPRMVSGRLPTPAGDRDLCPNGHTDYAPVGTTYAACGVCWRILFAGRRNRFTYR